MKKKNIFNIQIVDDTWTNDFALRNMIKSFKITDIKIDI